MLYRRCLILMSLAAAVAQEPAALFSPEEGSFVKPGPLRVVARAMGKAVLLLDGKPVAAQSPAPGVLDAEIEVTAGAHQLTVRGDNGEATVRFTGGEQAGKQFRPHPPVAMGCDTCHAVKENTWALKRVTLSPLCGQCHDRAAFSKVHTHGTDILADCQNCHQPHGGARTGYLKMAKETACKQCHS